MHRRAPLSTVLAAAGLLAAAATAGPAAASAADSSTGAPPSHAAATTAAEQRRVVDYWTPERMRSAVDASVLAADGHRGTAEVERGRPTVVQAVSGRKAAKGKPVPGGAGVTGAEWTSGGQVVQTTGKVFFSIGTSNYVCSGSAVSSANESTVLTAGHCVSDGGQFVTNFAFVPAYDDGARPYGTWTARSLTTTSQWKNGEDFNYDVAFAVMNTSGGATLTDTVGGQGIGFNLARGTQMSSFGYPQARPYDGTDLTYCSGVVVQDTYYGSDDQGMACDMTGGSSGGPWFYAFNGSTGTLNSVNSFGYRGIKDVMWGPYFGSVAQSLYSSTQSS